MNDAMKLSDNSSHLLKLVHERLFELAPAGGERDLASLKKEDSPAPYFSVEFRKDLEYGDQLRCTLLMDLVSADENVSRVTDAEGDLYSVSRFRFRTSWGAYGALEPRMASLHIAFMNEIVTVATHLELEFGSKQVLRLVRTRAEREEAEKRAKEREDKELVIGLVNASIKGMKTQQTRRVEGAGPHSEVVARVTSFFHEVRECGRVRTYSVDTKPDGALLVTRLT